MNHPTYWKGKLAWINIKVLSIVLHAFYLLIPFYKRFYRIADFILPTSRRYGGGMVANEQNYHKITRQPYAMLIPSSSFKCACATQSRSSFKPILFAFPLYLGFNYCIWFVLHFKVGWVFSMFSFVWYWNSAIVNFLPSKERSQLCQIVCLCILVCDSLKRKLHRILTCYVIEFTSYNF